MDYFYFAGRPVAQLKSAGATSTWTFLTTDHLGTPLLATDLSKNEVWRGPFEPFGRDVNQTAPSSARGQGIFLGFPGQWDDGRWQNASAGADLYYNVHRWYEFGTGRYGRVDPLGIVRVLSVAHPYDYAATNPIFFVDPFGLDAVTDDPNMQNCFFCMLKGGGFGTSEFEKAAWVTSGATGGFNCVTQGWVSKRGKATWPGGLPLPVGSVGFAHTHPTRSRAGRSTPRPSENDRDAADRIRRPVYTITPQGIWKYDPGTGKTTQEAPSNWTKGPRQRCKGRCKEIIQ